MPRIPEEVVQQVLDATDITDLVGQYFPLSRAGKDYRALCPFHDEKTPSFYVIPDKQIYHCFGCGAGGSALRFLMEYENADFRTALEKLAARANITLPEDAPEDPAAERQRRRRSHLLHVLTEASRFYQGLLEKSGEGGEARDYLADRKVDAATAADWQLGYAPEQMKPLADWAKDRGFTARDLVEAGLASLRDENNPRQGIYPRFRRRLMFPIHNDYGDVIAFSGRLLDPEAKAAKYINCPETSLFHKGDVLYGLHRAKRPILKRSSALVCEGQMDLISLAGAGFDHAVAPLGTALTPRHARLLQRHTKVVHLCYDGDAAGLKAVDRAFAVLAAADVDVRVALLPEGEDPDSIIRAGGPGAMEAVLAGSAPWFDLFLKRHRAELEEGSLADRTEVARRAAGAVACFHDPLLRDSALRQAATRLGLEQEMFRREVRAAAQRRQRTGENKMITATEDPAVVPERNSHPLAGSVEILCLLALRSSSVRSSLQARDAVLWQDIPWGETLNTILASSLWRDLGDEDDAEVGKVQNTLLATFPKEIEHHLRRLLRNHPHGDSVRGAQECLARLESQTERDHNRAIYAKLRTPGPLTEETLNALRMQQRKLDLKRRMENQSMEPSSASPPEDEPF